MNSTWQEEEYAERRQEMVAEVMIMAEEVSLNYGGVELSQQVLNAMSRVLRHRFVPEHERLYAYHNRPLPIGYGQTISQPYIVSLMANLLAVHPGDKVLEIGTGSGYQTAVLAELGVEVYSIEIVKPLATKAGETLKELGYELVHIKAGDGYQGWPEQAPFDAIIVTAGTSHVPQPLLDQLKPGGRMVIPIGETVAAQELLLINKDEKGEMHRQEVLPVRFVPLTGRH
jgi:protein-L-isoaspartate(D-aspartate) O-methyltransferase